MKKLILFSLVLFQFISCQKSDDSASSITYQLNIAVNPPDSGFVNPSSGTYESGQSVTINVSPNTNYEFDKWTGDWSGSTVPLVLTMDGDKNITANFIVSDSDSDGVVNTIDNLS